MLPGLYKRTKEHREGARRRMKHLWKDSSFAKKVKRGLKRGLKTMWADPAFRKRHSKSASEAVKRAWKNPEYVRKVLGSRKRPSKFQSGIFKELRKECRPLKCEYFLGGYFLDIVDVPRKKVLELDGVPYHSSRRAKARDDLKDVFLRERGWKVRRIRFGNTSDKTFRNTLKEARRFFS